MFFRTLHAFLGVCLLVIGGPTKAADITLRPDLAERLKTLYPIYGELPPGQSIYFDPLFNEQPENPMVILLEGPIQKGDAEKLEPFLKEYRHRFIFLNSPGGNFLEGMEIGRLLQEQRDGNGGVQLLGAIVLKEHQCLSACALAFALATLPRDAGIPVRYLEQGATLGFHMGLLPEHLAERTMTLREGMNLTYDVVAEFTALIRGGVTPPALLENALQYRDAKSFFFLKGGILSRFMGFTPVSSDTVSGPLFGYALSMDHVNSMCQILNFSSPGNTLTADEQEWYAFNFEGNNPLPKGMTLEDATKHLGSPRLKNDSCIVELRKDKSVGISVGPQDMSDCLQNRSQG